MPRSFVSQIKAANQALLVEGNIDAIGEFFSPDYIAHLTGTDLTGGHNAIRKVIKTYTKAFTDQQVDVEVLVKSKDRVAWQRIIRATHTSAFKGFPATNRMIVWRDMVTSRFEDGLIVEEWVLTDLAEQLLRLRKR